MRELLLTQGNLSRKLRQLLVLTTILLILPQTAWGTYYQSGGLNADNKTWGVWKLSDGATYSSPQNDYLVFTSASTITLTLTRPSNTTELIQSISLEIGDGIGTSTSLQSAMIGTTDITSSFQTNSGIYTYTPTNPAEWTGDIVITLQGANNQGGLMSASVYTTTGYGVTVAGTSVTSANATNIIGDGIAGTVTFTPASDSNGNINTLTINNATLTGPIVSSLDNLTIHLVGENIIKGTDNSNKLDNAISTAVSNATLNFTSGVNTDGVPTGKLLFPYVTTPISGFSNSNIVYENGLDLGVINDNIYSYCQGIGEINYSLMIGDIIVSSANCSNIIVGGNSIGSFNNSISTLTLNGASLTNSIAWSGNGNFIIELIGSNSITTGTNPCIKSEYAGQQLFFSKGNSNNPCSLTLNCNEGINVISGFNNDNDPTIGAGLSWIVKEESNNIISKAVVAEDYGITIAGIQVTSANASNVLNDAYSSVSYDSGENTLTLKGVLLNDTDDDIVLSSAVSALKINLVGCNTIGDISVSTAALTFTTNSTLPGCLKLNNISGNSTLAYENDILSWDATNNIIKARDYNEYLSSSYVTVNIQSVDGDGFMYSTPALQFFGASLQNEQYVTVSPESNNSTYVYPTDYDYVNNLTKIYFQFDWGANTTNHDVNMKIKGVHQETPSSYYVDDNTSYSEDISLSSYGNGDIVEVTLNEAVTSDNIGLFFTSDNDFSFVPITVGFLKTESSQNTENYDLWIGDTQVTSANISDYSGVSFNASTNTLSLENAEITSQLKYTGTADLVISLKGDNSISSTTTSSALLATSNSNPKPKISIIKAEGATDASLDLYVTNNASATAYEGFTIGTNFLGEGLYGLVPSTIATGSARYVITTKAYGLMVGGYNVQYYSTDLPCYKDNILGDNLTNGGEAKATFNPTGNILTLNNASITANDPYNVISSNLNALTICVKGNNTLTCDLVPLYSHNNNAPLTIVKDDTDTNEAQLILKVEGASSTPAPTIYGFGSLTYSDSFTPYSVNTDGGRGSETTISYDESAHELNLSKICFYAPSTSTTSYGITVADIEVTSENASSITGTGITGTVTFTPASDTNGNILTLNGATITGAIWLDTGTEMLTIAINGTCNVINENGTYALYTNGDGFNFVKATGANSAKLTATCGNGYTPISLASSSLDDGLYWAPVSSNSIIITDNSSEMLPAPTIAFDANKDYVATDKIAVTRNSNDQISTEIFYTWGDAEIGAVYIHNADNPTLTNYSNNNKIAVQSATLRAWVGYNYNGDNYYVLSEAASQTFTVKKDIASCTVNLPESATYNGEAYEPVVDDGATATAPTQLTLGTDYTVSYQKTDGGTATDVDAMIDAGTYKITITGAGNYTGTKEVSNFQIGQANLDDATISKLIFGGQEYTGTDIEIPYTGAAIQPSVVVTINDGQVTIDPSEYSVSWSDNIEISGTDESAKVTITSTGKNFTENSYTEKNFKIVRGDVTITANDQTVTYNGNAQEYSNATVDNANATLAIAYYPTVTDRAQGSNKLTGAPTDAGTYYVEVTQTNDNFMADDQFATFTIEQAEITEVILEQTELIYNKEEQTVNVDKVMAGTLEVDADYYEISGNIGTELGDYTVTVTAKENSGSFKNNFKGSATTTFKIIKKTVTIADLGLSDSQTFATYYNTNEDVYLPDGVVAYIIVGVSENSVTVKRISYIPKGVAVLVELGSSSETAGDDADGNLLVGTSTQIDVTAITGGTVYVLYNGEFVKTITGIIPANHCYLVTTASSSRKLTIVCDDTTAIDNGRLTMDNEAGEQWYDLQGWKIEKPNKAGLYIKNGKKTVIYNK